MSEHGSAPLETNRDSGQALNQAPGQITGTSPELLGRLLAHAAIGCAVFGLDGRLIESNTAFASMLGRSQQELAGMQTSAFIHPGDCERVEQDIQRLVSGASSSLVIEHRYLRPDSSLAWVRSSISRLAAGLDGAQAYVALTEDLTHFRLAERALIENEKLASIGRLSASIAHELNNPLESVVNLLFLIRQSDNLPGVHHYAKLAEQELQRVAEIATQTLRFHRQQTAPTPLHLDEIIDGVIALFEGRLRHGKVRLYKRYTVCDHSPVAHSGELRQVFLNLIGNALDAMEDEGTLRIDIRPSKRWSGMEIAGVRVTISDTGTGIPHDLLTKVFEPFVSTKGDRGTGLGLWISRDIIHRHGGRLNVRSATSGPRRGTAMSVFLPHGDRKNATLAA